MACKTHFTVGWARLFFELLVPVLLPFSAFAPIVYFSFFFLLKDKKIKICLRKECVIWFGVEQEIEVKLERRIEKRCCWCCCLNLQWLFTQLMAHELKKRCRGGINWEDRNALERRRRSYEQLLGNQLQFHLRAAPTLVLLCNINLDIFDASDC